MTIRTSTSSSKRVPDFVIAGAARSGTTALYSILKQHPDIFMPSIKEPNYFANMPDVCNGPGDYEHTLANVVRTWECYLDLYRGAKSGQVTGDASPSYLFFFDSAERIREANPKAKVIIILRNPIERAFSHYLHMCRAGREFLTFEQALDEEEHREAKGWEWSWCYKRIGLYSRPVQVFIDVFGSDNVMVCLHDRLVEEPHNLITDVCDFIGVGRSFSYSLSRRYNPSGVPRNKMLQNFLDLPNHPLRNALLRFVPRDLARWVKDKAAALNLRKLDMPDDTRMLLVDYYREDVRRLEKMLGICLSSWMRW